MIPQKGVLHFRNPGLRHPCSPSDVLAMAHRPQGCKEKQAMDMGNKGSKNPSGVCCKTQMACLQFKWTIYIDLIFCMDASFFNATPGLVNQRKGIDDANGPCWTDPLDVRFLWTPQKRGSLI